MIPFLSLFSGHTDKNLRGLLFQGRPFSQRFQLRFRAERIFREKTPLLIVSENAVSMLATPSLLGVDGLAGNAV